MKPRVNLLFLCLSVSICLADYSDGLIDETEYEEWVEWAIYNPPLIVDGGGANVIEIRENGRLEVRSTSTPVNGDWLTGGIRDIHLDDYSELFYLGGITDILSVAENATAVLWNGSINCIWSMQDVDWLHGEPTNQHIDLYCQMDWSWIDNDPLLGIEGKWLDGSSFYIEFINDEDHDPVWANINIIPEPATLFLISLGAVIVRSR